MQALGWYELSQVVAMSNVSCTPDGIKVPLAWLRTASYVLVSQLVITQADVLSYIHFRLPGLVAQEEHNVAVIWIWPNHIRFVVPIPLGVRAAHAQPYEKFTPSRNIYIFTQ